MRTQWALTYTRTFDWFLYLPSYILHLRRDGYVHVRMCDVCDQMQSEGYICHMFYTAVIHFTSNYLSLSRILCQR